MDVFFQQIINGLSIGAVYALIAVGYTMVYGILRLINFAHGDVFMVGAVVAFFAATSWFGLAEAPVWVGLPLVFMCSVVICCVLGFVIERFAYRPLRHQPRLTVLITAIGVSMLLEYGGQHDRIFGPTPQAFPAIVGGALTSSAGAEAGSVVINPVDIVIFLLTVVLMVALTLVIKYTKTGMALRAVSFRFDTAMLMGINVNRIISITFIVGSALAAVAGVLWGIKYRQVEPLMGLIPGLKAFIAAVFGGIGNIAGAVIGALVLGMTEVLVVAYLPGGSQYRDAVAFVVLIIILLVKPSGLLGQNVVEKV